jgi:hypothetical protein
MSQNSIEVSEECGCVLVRANDKADQEHRWWFDETDAGRLVFISEVIHFTDMQHEQVGLDGRHYVPEREADVPPKVESALDDEGYRGVFDTDGRPL